MSANAPVTDMATVDYVDIGNKCYPTFPQADRVCRSCLREICVCDVPLQKITLTIPGPPRSWKRAMRPTSGNAKGKYINPQKYEDNKDAVGYLLASAVAKSGKSREWWQSQRVSVEFRMFFENRRKKDYDRVLNLINDAGCKIVWRDDTWTSFEDGAITIEPKLDRANPRVEIAITALGELRVANAR